jgi:hypothetical protein
MILRDKILHERTMKTNSQDKIMKTCPNCNKHYVPVLKRKHPEIPIQREFPQAKAWEREQHISGICSDKCWNEYLG